MTKIKKQGRNPKFGEPLLHPSIGITQAHYDFIDKQPQADFAAKHRAVIDIAMNIGQEKQNENK